MEGRFSESFKGSVREKQGVGANVMYKQRFRIG